MCFLIKTWGSFWDKYEFKFNIRPTILKKEPLKLNLLIVIISVSISDPIFNINQFQLVLRIYIMQLTSIKA